MLFIEKQNTSSLKIIQIKKYFSKNMSEKTQKYNKTHQKQLKIASEQFCLKQFNPLIKLKQGSQILHQIYAP
jgi:hypothetical protein